MRRELLQLAPIVLLAASLTGMAFASNGNTRTAVPGTINYVEGQVTLDGSSLNSKSVGSAELQTGQSVSTETGKTEFLLTPGVYVRLADNSAATLVSPSLTDTRISVDKGEAMVEVDQLHKQNDISIVENGVSTELLKTGLYDFNVANDTVRVFDGKALTEVSDQNVTIKGGHELNLNDSGKMKTHKFNKKDAQATDLYRWSALRSDYLAEANVDAASMYFANGWYGPGWIGAGWYWDPWLSGFTFLPGDGFLYSPFGWGFYSPLWVYRSPLWYGGYYGGYYGRPGFVGHPPNRGVVAGGHVGRPVGSPAFRGGFHGGVFHSAGGFRNSGFRAGGGFGISGGRGFSAHR